MTTTMLIAQLLLPVYAITTISILINAKRYKSVLRNIAESPALVYVVSLINLMGGTAIVLYHNTRVSDRSVVITIIGWLMILKGAIYMLLPHRVERMVSRASKKSNMYVGVVIAAIITIILFSVAGRQG